MAREVTGHFCEGGLMHELLSHRARTAESSAIRDLLRHAEAPGVLSLAGGLPSAAMFPLADVARAARCVLAEPSTLQYGLSEGSVDLRALLAGPDGDPSRFVVTTGSQQALDLLGRVLLDPGDQIVVPDPCYVGARQALGSTGATLVGIPGDTDGLDTDALADRLASGLKPKAVYVVANFDNPSGVVLAPVRRRMLTALAERYDFVIIEDDPYGALRYDGTPVDDIGPESGHVVRLRTVSKTIAPGLRVGWMSGPAWVIEAVVVAKQSVDLHTSTVTQAIAGRLLGEPGWLDGHLTELRPWYRSQRDALVDALVTDLPSAEFGVPDGGMFLWVQLPGVNTTTLLPAAIELGVAFVPGPAFAVDRDLSEYLRLSFATVDRSEMGRAVCRLAESVARTA
jgi:2-aminoadipate transaminase